MLLTEADRDLFFPEVELSGSALMVGIRKAQMVAEQKAKRSLELKQYKDTLIVGAGGRCLTKLAPIALDPAPTVRFRHPGNRSFGLSNSASAWVDLPADNFSFEPLKGVFLLHPNISGVFEAEITYTSGFASEDESFEAQEVKQAIATILQAQAQKASAGGISRFTLNNFYSVEIDSSAADSELGDSFLLLQKWQPRTGVR